MAKRRTSTRSRKNTRRPTIIDDSVSNDVLFPPGMGHGYDPLQKAAHPVDFAAPPADMKVIPRSEWSARIKERKEMGSGLRDIRRRSGPNGGHIPSLGQNGQGFCWMYSVTGTVMMARAAAGQPYVRLSAHAGACKVKNFRDEGGWCGLGAKWIRENGQPPVDKWPERSMSRQYDTPDTWKEAAKYKITEDWVDLTKAVYDQNLTFDQVVTCLLLNIPCAVDFSWWAHSVCGLDVDEPESNVFDLVILNSWDDTWEDLGEAHLRGQKAIPDGAVATRVTPGS